MSAAAAWIPNSRFEQLREGRGILKQEGLALLELAGRLDDNFCAACDAVHACPGSVVVTGMGKAGLIGRKIAATLSSTGTRSAFLHPADAVHGDVGCVDSADIVLALSNSGETEEIVRLLPVVQQIGVKLIAVTADERSSLGRAAEIVVPLGKLHEAGPHGLAPTTSTTALLAVGDALALVVSRARGFTPRQFAAFHPAGMLGSKLKPVHEVMRRGDELRIAGEGESVRDVFISAGKPGRRSGAVMLVNNDGRLSGLFTDSDLARLLETRRDNLLDQPISNVMTRNPQTVGENLLLSEVFPLLGERKLSEIPVVDKRHRPVGLIDITDVIALLPTVQPQAAEESRT